MLVSTIVSVRLGLSAPRRNSFCAPGNWRGANWSTRGACAPRIIIARLPLWCLRSRRRGGTGTALIDTEGPVRLHFFSLRFAGNKDRARLIAQFLRNLIRNCARLWVETRRHNPETAHAHLHASRFDRSHRAEVRFDQRQGGAHGFAIRWLCLQISCPHLCDPCPTATRCR